MIVSTSGGNAPIAAWRSRAKLCFPPRQLCRSCLPTEDTRVKVLDRQSSNKDKDLNRKHNYRTRLLAHLDNDHETEDFVRVEGGTYSSHFIVNEVG